MYSLFTDQLWVGQGLTVTLLNSFVQNGMVDKIRFACDVTFVVWRALVLKRAPCGGRMVTNIAYIAQFLGYPTKEFAIAD